MVAASDGASPSIPHTRRLIPRLLKEGSTLSYLDRSRPALLMSMSMSITGLLACQPVAVAVAPSANNAGSASQAQVTVSYESSLGQLSPSLFGTQGLGVDADDARVQAAGFRVLTTHAPSYVPAEPQGYTSSALLNMDRDIAAIVKLGAEPWLYFYQIRKPDDGNRYFASIQTIARHIKETFPAARPIFFFGNEPDWEVVQCAGEIRSDFKNEFWNGTRQEFFATYGQFSQAIKSVESSYVVGGVGLGVPVLDLLPPDAPAQARACIPDETFSGRRGEVSRWVTDFLDYCQAHGVALDYLAFHAYSPAPYRRFYQYAGKVAAALARYPNLSPLYGQAKLATNEWSIQLTDDVGVKALCQGGGVWDDSCIRRLESMKTAHKSAHHLVGLIGMIDQGLSMNVSYSALYQDVPDRGTEAAKADPNSNCRYFTLVCSDSVRNAYHAFRGFNWLAGTERLATQGSDYLNFAALAGKASDGSVIVALGNYDASAYAKKYPIQLPQLKAAEEAELTAYEASQGSAATYDSFRVTLNGAPWPKGKELVVEHYAVDEEHLLELVKRQTLSAAPTLVVEGEMARPSAQFLRIRLK